LALIPPGDATGKTVACLWVRQPPRFAAQWLGKKDPRSIRIELKISHEELSEMVGTTRPRISFFMQRFRNLGLIETNRDRFLIIKESKLSDYLAHIA
jgi:hypothetical protein